MSALFLYSYCLKTFQEIICLKILCSGRKKKQVNAEEKLRRFHELKQKVTEQPVTSMRKTTYTQNRTEYFKGKHRIYFTMDSLAYMQYFWKTFAKTT